MLELRKQKSLQVHFTLNTILIILFYIFAFEKQLYERYIQQIVDEHARKHTTFELKADIPRLPPNTQRTPEYEIFRPHPEHDPSYLFDVTILYYTTYVRQYLNLVEEGLVSPYVGDQGSCNACEQFAVADLLQSVDNKKKLFFPLNGRNERIKHAQIELKFKTEQFSVQTIYYLIDHRSV